MSSDNDISSFEDLGLSDKILSAIADCGYTNPTPIQGQAIPIILMSRDIIGQAQTGSGKTASFTLPMIDILAGKRARAMMPRSLILTPTRELAAQVAENFETYGKNTELNSALLVGGESIREQKKILGKGVDVLIATPGRLLDLFEQGELLLNDIKVLVIDEADRMLDMGFIPDIEKIISLLPFQRQTLLFSATMPPPIRKLADRFLSNPKMITIEPPAGSKNIEQKLIWVSKKDKKKALLKLLETDDIKNAFVFCNRKRDVDELSRFLKSKNLSAQGLHGDMPQKIRSQTLKDFKDGKIVYLICSDVAARGLDVDAVSHVFNYDVPFNSEDYVHRIGRTGRAGQTGVSITLATPDELNLVEDIDKEINKKLDDTHIEGVKTLSRDQVSGQEDQSKDTERKPSKSRSKKKSSGSSGSSGNERSQSSSRPDKKQSKSKDSNDNHKIDEEIVGFGDDIPAFLK